MSLTNLSLAGNNLIIFGLVSDVPVGDGKIINYFYSVRDHTSDLFKLFYSNLLRNSTVLISIRNSREGGVRLYAQESTRTFDIAMTFLCLHFVL